MKRKVSIDVQCVSFTITDEMRQADEERSARNRRTLKAAELPWGPGDIHAGDIVVPAEEQWQRGNGVVDTVDALGRVWATYGQRENPHPTDSKTIRCCAPWMDLRIVERATKAAR